MNRSPSIRMRRLASRAAASLVSLALLFATVGCGLSMNGTSVQTSVAPLPGEDLASNCVYDLTIFTPRQIPLQGVLVIFDRADSVNLYGDYDVQQFASDHQLAMLFPQQCNAASYPDIQDDASKGPGRSLLAALNQFATLTQRPELATSNLLVFGFSAAGVLTATLSNYAPTRILGAMEYADGSSYLDISTLDIPHSILGIPTLLMSNADDNLAGTYVNYRYFQRGRAQSAKWAYAVQNDTGHCCSDSTKPLILPWMDSVLGLRARPDHSPALLSPSAGDTAAFLCTPDTTTDYSGNADCRFTYAAIGPGSDTSGASTAWLPSPAAAQAWLAWVTHPSTN